MRRAHPATCQLFIECMGTQAIIQPCNRGMFFDPVSQACDEENIVLELCVNKTHRPTDVFETTQAGVTTTEVVTTTVQETTTYVTTQFGECIATKIDTQICKIG